MTKNSGCVGGFHPIFSSLKKGVNGFPLFWQVANLIMTPTNKGVPHGIPDFDLAAPVAYVQVMTLLLLVRL